MGYVGTDGINLNPVEIEIALKGKNIPPWVTVICEISFGSMKTTTHILDRDTDVLHADKDSNTAVKYGTGLIWAAKKGRLGMVRFLVENGADVNAKGDNANTAKITAAEYGHLNVVQYLVEHGADKESKDNDGRSALISAAQKGHIDVVRYLIEKGADKEAKDNNGNTALINAACCGHLNMVEFLVMQGVDKEANNNDGYTALISAASCGHLDVVECLVMQGVDASRLDNRENSVLVHLLNLDTDEDKILQPARLLLEYGAPPLQSNKEGKSAKSIARKKNFNEVMDLLEEYAAKPRREPDSIWFISPDDVKSMGRELGRGSFGKVYQAKWAGSIVVVKEISVVEMPRFLKEVRTWRELTHDNVVPFFGANNRKEPFFIVSKYASNGELVPYIKRMKKQGQTIVWQKLREVAAGLSYLHDKKIVHGDLRGNNIVVSNDGTAMLTDFGLSFTESGSCFLKTLKDTLGAMQWRAPELAMMTTMTPTRKSDIYSLGMCIIEAMIGTTPWGVGNEPEEIRGFLRRNEVKLEKPGEMTGDQWVLVSRMIEFEPGNRPDMEDVLSELEKFAETEMKNEEARQVGNNAQDAHDTDVHENNGVGAVNVQSGGTHRTPAQTSTASTNWSNRRSVSTSF